VNHKILDACCGARMFWFDKNHPDALYVDARRVERQVIWSNGEESREFEVNPDVQMDFRALDLPDDHFHLVVFDPPHLHKRNGKTGWMHKKYGSLGPSWNADLSAGFAECFRVLRPNGTLVFKWSSIEIPLREVLTCSPVRPLFGHKTGRHGTTHWLCFMKPEAQ
jgi:SAM-dependent methyltransferase